MKSISHFFKVTLLSICLLILNQESIAQCTGYTATINKTADGFFINDVSLQVTITGGSGSINLVEWSPWGTGIFANNRGAGMHMAIVRDTFYGCIDTAYITVTDTFNCKYLQVQFYENDSCYQNDITLYTYTGLGSGNYTYAWSSGETTPNVYNKTAGVYTVSITDVQYGCTDTFKSTIVDDTCNFCQYYQAYIYENDSCGYNDVTLSVYASNNMFNSGSHYVWNSGSTKNTISSQTSGTFYVVATDSAYGCKDTAYYNLSDDTCVPCQNFNVNVYGYEGCKANDVQLYSYLSMNDTFVSYLWNTGDTSKDLKNRSTGTYTLTVTSSQGCIDTASYTMTDSVYRCCSANFYLSTDSLQGDSSLLSFSNYFLSNATSDVSITKYNWSFGDGFDGSGSYVFHQYANTGVKTVCHYVEDVAGCKDTFCKTKNLPPNGQNIGVKTFHTAIVPGQPCYYYLFYSNLGNTVASNVNLSLFYPDSMILNNASTSYTTSTNAINFNIGTMNVGQSGYITVYMTTPTNFTVGTVKKDSTIITPVLADVVAFNNYVINLDNVRGSYDPNEMLVSPNGEGANGNIDPNTKELSYLINFQNEGNWRTYKVRVENEVDPNMDLSSLLIGETSHQVRLVLNGRKLVWYFDDINLSPKADNEPMSHGFIQYTMKLKNNLPVGTSIKNTAHIYFDYNTAILTNTAISTLFLKTTNAVENAKINGIDFEAKMIDGKLIINSDTKITQVKIYNLEGKLVENQFSNSKKIELNPDLNTRQIYIIHVEMGESTVVKKFQF